MLNISWQQGSKKNLCHQSWHILSACTIGYLGLTSTVCTNFGRFWFWTEQCISEQRIHGGTEGSSTHILLPSRLRTVQPLKLFPSTTHIKLPAILSFKICIVLFENGEILWKENVTALVSKLVLNSKYRGSK